MAPLQLILHGAATSTGTDGRMLTYFPKNLSGSGSEPVHTLEMNYSWNRRASLCCCSVREGALQREGEHQLQSPLAKETLHETLTVSEMGLHAHPGGLGRQLSRALGGEASAQSRGTELSMSWHSSAASPCSTQSHVLS